jgi:hypothetical protein
MKTDHKYTLGHCEIHTNKQGWICPKCGRVYSPSWFQCSHCNRNCDHEFVSEIDNPFVKGLISHKGKCTKCGIDSEVKVGEGLR